MLPRDAKRVGIALDIANRSFDFIGVIQKHLPARPTPNRMITN